jgi:hypothetical protein
MVLVLWKKTEMVPPYIFLYKTDGFSHQQHVTAVFFFLGFNKKKIVGWLNHHHLAEWPKRKKTKKKKKKEVLALGIGVAKPLLGQMGVAKSEK